MAKGSSLAAGILVGALAGAVAGLLLAPTTGKESRRIVADRTQVIRQKAGTYVGTLRQKMGSGSSN